MFSRRLMLFGIAFGLVASPLLTTPAQAQILLVTGNYVVTEIDQGNLRFGVALPEAKATVRQNWVYLTPKTEINQQLTNHAGWHKDQALAFMQFFEVARAGQPIKIHGGRRWDGEITAKKLWIDYPEEK